MTDPGRGEPPTVARRAGAIAGAVAAALLGKYSGINLLIPAAAAFAAGWAAWKLASADKRPMIPAFAVQVGHGLWIALGLALLRVVSWDLLDPVILVGGGMWLIARPGLVPVALLGAFQLLALFLNTQAILAVDVGGPLHRALVVHIALRIAALGLMGTGLWTMRRRSRPAT